MPKLVTGQECKSPSRDKLGPSGSFGEGPTEIVAGPVNERFSGKNDGDEVRKLDQEDSRSTATVDSLKMAVPNQEVDQGKDGSTDHNSKNRECIATGMV
ncbi:hypothetical protein L6452_34983 [Arctium lappa]|uniref:Uncharacterized protein n=1 Tax=Arctium lappa TaxID=4217 RepID=A0ACB8YKX2_ARCLA|nr:hypothetical protein L6452_34983 [Arctium lappa]